MKKLAIHGQINSKAEEIAYRGKLTKETIKFYLMNIKSRR